MICVKGQRRIDSVGWAVICTLALLFPYNLKVERIRVKEDVKFCSYYWLLQKCRNQGKPTSCGILAGFYI